MKKTLEYYLALPYTRVIVSRNDDGDFYYYGKIAELDGCQAHGETLAELGKNLDISLRMHIESMLEESWEIPEPKEFNGKVLFRMPESLHRRLYYEAKAEGVSLNQYGVSKLAR